MITLMGDHGQLSVPLAVLAAAGILTESQAESCWHALRAHGVLYHFADMVAQISAALMEDYCSDGIHDFRGNPICPACGFEGLQFPNDPYGNGTLVPSDHWGKGCPEDCDVHHGHE